MRRERWNSGKAASDSDQEPNQFHSEDTSCFEESGEWEDALSRGTATKPVAELNHEEEFERAWADPRNTRVELPPVEVNLVLARHYRTSKPLTFTRTMLWDMEVKKGLPARPLHSFCRIGGQRPLLVQEGGGQRWRILRAMLPAAPLAQAVRARVGPGAGLPQPRAAERHFHWGGGTPRIRTGTCFERARGQPLFHVEHSVDGDESRPLNRWRIVFLTGRPRTETDRAVHAWAAGMAP